MKNIFKTLAAVALIAMTAACSKDGGVAPVATEKATVSFDVQLPGGIVGRAETNDGTTAKQLYYAVYSDIANDDQALIVETKQLENKSAVVSMDLVTNQTYDIVFWAQSPDSGYAIDWNTKTVSLNYDQNEDGSNENRDAFVYVWHNLEVNGAVNEPVTLKRPFAQLNVGLTYVSEENNQIKKAQVAGFNLGEVQVKAYTYNQFCFVNGQGEPAGQQQEVIFKAAANTTDMKQINGTNYNWVSFNYVMPNASQSELQTIKIDFYDGAKQISIPEFTNVPVERNHRTNIVGDLLTDPANFNVSIDATFDDPANDIVAWDGVSVQAPTTHDEQGNPQITTGAELAWLAGVVNGTISRGEAENFEGQTIVLGANIDLGGHPWTPIGYNPNEVAGNENYFAGTFDGNGYTISNLKIDVKDQGGVGLFGAVHNATFKNFTLSNVNIKAVESEANPTNISGAQNAAAYIAGGHIGAVAGYDAKNGTVSFENVHVSGEIKIEGETRVAQGQRVGGIIGGRASSRYTFNNVSVIGDEGSYIKGFCSTAGVIGQNQEAATFENVTTDIDVYAVTFGAGGIAGIARQGSTFTNCSSKGDITLDASHVQPASYSANYCYRLGGIAGCWSESKTGKLTLTNCSYEGQLTSIDKEGNSPASFDYAGYVGRGYALKNCAGSTVTIDGVNYVQAYDNVYGFYIIDGAYGISNATIAQFRTKVNAGDGFQGKTVKLIEDIDLQGQNWTPIGNEDVVFEGTFDGNGKTIKNLNITYTEPAYFIGFFGCVEGATIKNVTFENAIVNVPSDDSNSGGHIAAIAGYAVNTTFEKIEVKGDVKVESSFDKNAASRVAVVAGGNYGGKVEMKNVVINANADSYVKANNCVGALAGQLQGEVLFENCSSNIDVTGYKFFAGGIIGLAPRVGQFTDCATSGNVAITNGRAGNANDLYRVGAIAGGWDDNTTTMLTLTNCSYTGQISGKDANGTQATNFVCGGYVGRGYSAVVGAKVSVNGDVYEYQGDGKEEIKVEGLDYDETTKSYAVSTAKGLVALANKGLKADESVVLTADIDLTGVEFNGINAFHAENNNTFDGNGFTVSNWTNHSGASDMAFVRNWVGTIKNLTIANASLKTSGRSGIIAGNVYANIENCRVVNCTLEDSYWACGLIAGLYNSGSIKNCSATNSTIKSNGGTGAIVGVMNESAGARSFTNCKVKGCTVNNTGVYGDVYCGAMVCGMINCDATITFEGCVLENNTAVGLYVGELYYGNPENVVVK